MIIVKLVCGKGVASNPGFLSSFSLLTVRKFTQLKEAGNEASKAVLCDRQIDL